MLRHHQDTTSNRFLSPRFHGVLVFIMSFCRVYDHYTLHLEYLKPGIAWLYMHSKDYIFLVILFGVVGMVIGGLVFCRKLRIRYGYGFLLSEYLIPTILELAEVPDILDPYFR